MIQRGAAERSDVIVASVDHAAMSVGAVQASASSAASTVASLRSAIHLLPHMEANTEDAEAEVVDEIRARRTPAPSLLTLDPSYVTTSILACQSNIILSCVVARVNLTVLDGKELTLPGGEVVTMEDRLGVDSVTFVDALGTEATFSYSQGEVFGNVDLEDGRDFVLEPCFHIFKGCHVWIEEDLEDINNEEDGDTEEVPVSEIESLTG